MWLLAVQVFSCWEIAMLRFALLVVFVTLFTGSIAQASSYQKTDRTIVNPIRDTWGDTHYTVGQT